MASVQRTSAAVDDRIGKQNFERLSRFIYDYSGIKMPSSKLTMLEGRLRRRLRATGHPTFDSYCDFLFTDRGQEQEAVFLIDAVTTNKTDFFREPSHFKFLMDEALPALTQSGVRRLRAWSSACSTGAEPYTMAMVMEDYVESNPDHAYAIMATDLSTDVLAIARRGIYSDDVIAPVPSGFRRRHVMEALEPRRREVRIHPRLRARVAFGRLNLMDPKYVVGDPVHLLFCRNVLIYFDKPTQAEVLSRLCDCLAVGGYLFIGHSESVTGFDLPLRPVANTVFQRI